MGQFYFLNQIDDSRWFNLGEYFEISFHYDYGRYANPKDYDNYLAVKEWPKLRKWIRDECSGDVIIYSDGNSHGRRWTTLYFECESDAMAFKLRWL